MSRQVDPPGSFQINRILELEDEETFTLPFYARETAKEAYLTARGVSFEPIPSEFLKPRFESQPYTYYYLCDLGKNL